ncbi:Clo7bot family Cys-rich peptide [Clostridium senegalense]|nr:Clo7bot family Cys-rich peptide [Clostridium senegalense]MBU5225622.1 Clo7bot family Cys-rich peptide [Clostridium senegalense]
MKFIKKPSNKFQLGYCVVCDKNCDNRCADQCIIMDPSSNS